MSLLLAQLQANGHLTPARAATPPAHSPGGASTSSSQNSHLPPRVPALVSHISCTIVQQLFNTSKVFTLLRSDGSVCGMAS